MKKTVVLHEGNGGVSIFYLELEDGYTLPQALREAALAYGQTEEGHKLFLKEGGLAYGDILKNLPEGNAIHKTGEIIPDFATGSREYLLTGKDAPFILADSDVWMMDEKKICEAAVQLGIMWGTVKILEGMEVLRYQETGMLLAWAEEFSSSPEGNLPDFFLKKLEGIERGEAWQ